jgi:hypothetical protein
VGIGIWIAVSYLPSEETKKERVGYKQLSRTVAEGFVYRFGSEKYPRASCSACRIGKMKIGFVSLGAINTIEFDDLIINIPESQKKDGEDITTRIQDGKSETEMVVDAFNLNPVIRMACAEAKKFAGIRISKLQINRMSRNSLEPIIHASTMKNSGKRILLYNVVLHKDGQTHKLKEVELEVKPDLKLVWSTGSWDLTDVLSGVGQ